jgi:hypothetical protein
MVGPLAAGRTIYLQPIALFVNGDPNVEEPPANAAVGQCQIAGAPEVLARTQDFPVTFTGDALPIPVPGDQEVTLSPSGPVSPGDKITVNLSGFLPGALVAFQECPVDADPCPDIEGPPTSTITVTQALLSRSGASRLALDRAATEPNLAFIDDDGTGSATLVIADPDDSGCGPQNPCDVVAQDVFDEEFVGRASIQYSAEPTPTPTPTATATATPTATADQSGSTLPDTGAVSLPLGAAGSALLLLGLAMIASSRLRVQRH